MRSVSLLSAHVAFAGFWLGSWFADDDAANSAKAVERVLSLIETDRRSRGDADDGSDAAPRRQTQIDLDADEG